MGQKEKVFEVYGEIEANGFNLDYAVCRDADKTVTVIISSDGDIVNIEFSPGYDDSGYDKE